MPRTCTICVHPNRNEIETELENRSPFRNIAEQFRLTASAVFRHKAHQTDASLTVPLVVTDRTNTTPAPNDNPENLTGKQQAFIDFYFGEAKFNGTEAARLAGYSGNDSSLAVTASQLLRNAKVAATIAVRFKAMHITADQVIAEISRVAQADWNEFLNVKTKDGQTVSVQMSLRDKLKALEMAGKNLGILADVVIQERIVVFAQTVYYRMTDELGLADDDETRGLLLPILGLEPEQLKDGPADVERLAS
jgi:phage terminase small subunit